MDYIPTMSLASIAVNAAVVVSYLAFYTAYDKVRTTKGPTALVSLTV